jgi:hypothetical protein
MDLLIANYYTLLISYGMESAMGVGKESALAGAQPSTQAFLLCDRVITEKGTHKKTLVGVFTSIWAHGFPLHHTNLALYYRGVLNAGEYDFRINFARQGSDEVLSHVEGILRVKNGSIPTELGVNLPFLDIPEPGEYEFRMWIEEAYVQRVGLGAGLIKDMKGE